jgi:hypothetical protein
MNRRNFIIAMVVGLFASGGLLLACVKPEETFPTEEQLQLIRRNFPDPYDVWPNLDNRQ